MIDVSSSIFKVAFTNFAFLLFLIRIVSRSLLSRSLRFDSHIQMCGIRNFTHDERELNFIHTAHTGMTRHLLDLRMTHDSCRVDCITTNLFSTSTSNLNYNSADAEKYDHFTAFLLFDCIQEPYVCTWREKGRWKTLPNGVCFDAINRICMNDEAKQSNNCHLNGECKQQRFMTFKCLRIRYYIHCIVWFKSVI